MRILGIETSSRRGSVALVDSGVVVARAVHEQPNAHAERVLGLVEELLATASWSKQSLDRVGVGVGPGSFTGLRVGLALAQGIALGLSIPAVGVGSLWAMASAAPAEIAVRVPLLDARRGEVFCAAYAADGLCLSDPRPVPVADLETYIVGLELGSFSLIGEPGRGLAQKHRWITGQQLDLPDAARVALAAEQLDPASAPAVPLYVRGPDAIKPNLPPSPLG